MQIVIDIPDKVYQDIQARDWNNSIWARDSLMRYIHEGVVLPKHHGRLIDADRLMRVDHIILESQVDNAPTIIEATEEVD